MSGEATTGGGEALMAEYNAPTTLHDDFIERNAARLKGYVKKKYVLSRVPTYWLAFLIGAYFWADAFYFHEGVPQYMLWVLAVFLIDTNIDKFILRLLQFHVAKSALAPLVPRPDDDPRWMRVMLWLAVKRRGAVKFLVLITEYATLMLFAFAFSGELLERAIVRGFTWVPPFVELAPWSFATIKISPNIVDAVVIVFVAGFLTTLTNATFYLKIEKVRTTLWDTIGALITKSSLPAKSLAEMIFAGLGGRRATDSGCCPNTQFAHMLLHMHPLYAKYRALVLPHQETLIEEMKAMIEGDAVPPSEVLARIGHRIKEIAEAEKKKPTT